MDYDLSQFLDTPGADGWVGGLMDEYARAAVDFCHVLEGVPAEQFLEQRATSDPDCASIQNLCVHVVGAAHGYANLILRALGSAGVSAASGAGIVPAAALGETPTGDAGTPAGDSRDVRFANPAFPASVRPLLTAALKRTEAILHDIHKLPEPEQEAITIRPRWGLPMQVDLLIEHAIVHLLRHRRQIERW